MSTTLNVRINGPLEDFIADKIGENGSYENASEYVRDLIRKDKDQTDQAAFEALKAELERAFSAPDSAYKPFDRDEFLARARQRRAA